MRYIKWEKALYKMRKSEKPLSNGLNWADCLPHYRVTDLMSEQVSDFCLFVCTSRPANFAATAGGLLLTNWRHGEVKTWSLFNEILSVPLSFCQTLEVFWFDCNFFWGTQFPNPTKIHKELYDAHSCVQSKKTNETLRNF